MKKFEIMRKDEVTAEHISDLLVTAFEGGINYWCEKVEVLAVPDPIPDKVILSDVIALGGALEFYDLDAEGEDDIYELTLEKMLKGIEMGLTWGKFGSVEDMMDNYDAETADVIIQFALFGEIVYG